MRTIVLPLEMEKARQYFSQYIEICDAEWELFASRFKLVSHPKKTIIVKEGDEINHIYFIKSGILRQFLISDDKEYTISFKFENEFASPYNSFITRQPSEVRIEALTPVELWALHYDDLQYVYKNTKIGNAMGRIAAEHLYIEKFKRELSLLNKDAEARYIEMFEDYKELINDIPQKHLASYIGVTPQSLSRIKKKLFKDEENS